MLNTKYFYNIDKSVNKKNYKKFILEDFNIFITSGINESSSNIGCLYVLTALASVSNECIQVCHGYFNNNYSKFNIVLLSFTLIVFVALFDNSIRYIVLL